MTQKETTLQITGMTCAACSNRIEKSLNRMDGVNEATVNLALEKSNIQYDPNVISEKDLHKKIEDLGYGVILQKAEFDITGMTCAACSARIEKVVSKLPGVDSINVNLALEKGTVHFNPEQVTLQDIFKRMEKIGFGAIVKEENGDTTNHREKAINKQKWKFIISAILSLPLLWTMVGHFSFTSFIYVPEILMNTWFQLILATPVQFIIGRQFYVGAYKALRNGSANMDVLVVMGTSAAYFYSVYQMAITSSHHGPNLYFETSAVLITLILLGKYFEAKAKGKSSEAIKKLMGLQANEATVYRNEKELIIPLEEVVIGDVVLIKPGEKVPVDGIVIEGKTAIDESMLTGESLPVEKISGDELYGSTINKNGFIKMKATKVGRDTALAQIIKVVEDAQGSKAPIQRLADKISGIFVPIVVGIAVLTFIIWLIFIDRGNFTQALEVLIAVLVIACPCALGLATPTSIMAGSGKAAEYGILFKGGEHLEQTQAVDTVVLDKTGTITLGKPVLTDVKITSTKLEENEVLSLVGSAEKNSEHPLAEAIVQSIIERKIQFNDPQDFEAIPGFGIKAVVNDKKIVIGTRKLMNSNSIDIAGVLTEADAMEEHGKTVMFIAIDGEFIGYIAVADAVKETSKRAIERLHSMDIQVVMMTGDNERTANAIAKEVGITHVIAEVLPEGKAAHIQMLQQEGKNVAMVGDGINDAPALATANVGMAIGTGTDVAMEAADITLIRGDLNSIVDAITMSRKTMRNIKQNLFWAFAYNTIGIPIAAIGLLAPWVAGAAMAFSSVSVVLNALRLQRVKLNK